jgi:predicted unusual protein kinase regulating ubiquinone biosynthesis (AarF/ABC1/UbiB family)
MSAVPTLAEVDERPPSAGFDLRMLTPQDAARLLEIGLTFARNGVVVIARRGPYLVLKPRRRGPRSLAVALRRSFAELGPIFVKFGQVVASSPGLFPGTVSDELRKLLDEVPPERPGTARRIIERSLGAPVDELFSRFVDEPVASASVAQVHEAWLHDGTHVAVKVRRPRLRQRAKRDLRLLRVGALALERTGIGRIVNPVAIVDDFASTLAEELDLTKYAAFMADFAANLRTYGTNDSIVVPVPVEGMVSPHVLVMSYVDGVSVDDAGALRAAGHDLEELLRRGVRAWMESAFEHGLFHGDVHAGNLLVTPDGQVALLDFGIMGRLDDRTRKVLRAALPALLIEGDYRRVVHAFFELGAATRPVDVESAAADVESLVGPMLRRGIADIAFGEVLGHILEVAGRYHVRLPRELVLVVKQLLYFERYATELAPDYPILGDRRILEHLLGSDRTEPVARPKLSVAPVTRTLPGDPGDPGGLGVDSQRDATFSWRYEPANPQLAKLYSKAKGAQWNATTDLDWSIDVDPLAPGGMASVTPLLASEAFSRFNDRERAEASWHLNAWITSQFLHGEQGALLATSKLVQQVPWTEAKYYGATQVIDEARHVEAYGRYLLEKLELTYPVNPNLQRLLELVIADPRWDVTYLGMQIIVEGIALAAFGLIHQYTDEPLIKEITRLVMRDEARHVAFGALSLTGLYDEMTQAERREREDFVLEAAWLMRDRFLATEVWDRLGIPQADGLRDSQDSPMLQLFSRILFAKVTPNLAKIGLLSDRLRGQLIEIGAVPDDL